MAFIPGRLSDHNLLDDKYVYRLRMMSGSLSAAMEQGCWCELQGAYFANWKASKMVIPYGNVGALWWDAHFISLDYGFGKSSASAHLHVRTQDGKIKTIGEFVAPHLPAYEFAGEVVRRFVAPQTDKGNRRKIVAVYLDPANFKNIGDGHTIANQINPGSDHLLLHGGFHGSGRHARWSEKPSAAFHYTIRSSPVCLTPSLRLGGDVGVVAILDCPPGGSNRNRSRSVDCHN